MFKLILIAVTLVLTTNVYADRGYETVIKSPSSHVCKGQDTSTLQGLLFWQDTIEVDCVELTEKAVLEQNKQLLDTLNNDLNHDVESSISYFTNVISSAKYKSPDQYVRVVQFLWNNFSFKGEETPFSKFDITFYSEFEKVLGNVSENNNGIEKMFLPLIEKSASYQEFLENNYIVQGKNLNYILTASYIAANNYDRASKGLAYLLQNNSRFKSANNNSDISSSVSIIASAFNIVFPTDRSLILLDVIAKYSRIEMASYVILLSDSYNEELLGRALAYSDLKFTWSIHKHIVSNTKTSDSLLNSQGRSIGIYLQALRSSGRNNTETFRTSKSEYNKSINNISYLLERMKKSKIDWHSFPYATEVCTLVASPVSVYSLMVDTERKNILNTIIQDLGVSPDCAVDYSNLAPGYFRNDNPTLLMLVGDAQGPYFKTMNDVAKKLGIDRSLITTTYAEALVSNGADINFLSPSGGALHLADKLRYISDSEEVNGVRFSFREEQENMFEEPNTRYNMRVTKSLLKLGVDPNLTDQNGNTALMKAITEGFYLKAQTLLPVTDLTITNNAGFNAQELAAMYDAYVVDVWAKYNKPASSHSFKMESLFSE